MPLLHQFPRHAGAKQSQLRWCTVAAIRHVAWRRIWLCLCLCLRRCLDLCLCLSACLWCPVSAAPFSVASVILSLPLSLSGRTIDKSGRRVEGGVGATTTMHRNTQRGAGEGATRGRRCGGGQRKATECWGQTTGEWKGAREEARGAGKQTPAGQRPQLGKYAGEPMGRALFE